MRSRGGYWGTLPQRHCDLHGSDYPSRNAFHFSHNWVIFQEDIYRERISHSRSLTGNGLQSHWKLQKLRLLKKEKTEAQLFSHTGETFCRKKKKKERPSWQRFKNCTEAIHGECKMKIFQCKIRNKFLKVSAIQEHRIARCPASFEQPPLTILYLPWLSGMASSFLQEFSQASLPCLSQIPDFLPIHDYDLALFPSSLTSFSLFYH